MFFGKDTHFVGVDIGTSSIKVVELTYKDDAPHLSNYGYADLDFGSAVGVGRGASHEVRKKAYLLALLDEMRVKTKSIFLAMPGYNGLVSFVEFPLMNEEDLAQAIQYEAYKYIPAELKDVSMSWEIVKKEDEEGKLFGKSSDNKKKTPGTGKMEVLLVAALKKDVAKYEVLISGTQYELKALELETFSLMRSLADDYFGTYLIIDIGFKVCNFVLVDSGVVRVNRNIDVGGNEITKAIAESMKISEVRANQMKLSGRDFFHQKEFSIIFPGLELTISEAKRIIQVFRERKPEAKIDKLILSGGSAGFVGMRQYFEEKLNIPTELGDPWKKVFYDKKIEPQIKKLGGAFSVAIGLAKRGVDEYKRK